MAASSPRRPEAHQETESEPDFDSEQGTESGPENHIQRRDTDSEPDSGPDSEPDSGPDSGPGSEPDSEPEIEIITAGADATRGDAGEHGDQDSDAASVKTATADLFSEPEDVPSGPESKQHKLGLDINQPWGWDGSAYSDYDVVTVHGIRDDYKTAWTDAQGDWWVKRDLFGGMSIRELDYSYEIDSASTLYEPDGIMQLARRLVTAYATVRQGLEETETDRPVIWICHDLGGTIVKEALCIAMQNPATYGKIAILTTAIIFLGTPHMFESAYDLEDRLCKLVLLPGPEIRDRTLSKARELARQVTRVNQRFLATKILDRAAIFNVFTHPEREDMKQNPVDEGTVKAKGPGPDDMGQDDDMADPVTPFSRYVHHYGHSFEGAGRARLLDVDHLALVRGEPSRKLGSWFSWLSTHFNAKAFPLWVNYRTLPFQAWLLSLAPPTRALGIQNLDQALPQSKHPVVAWIHEQSPSTAFFKLGGGPRLLHLHADGNHLLDISRASRLFYRACDMGSLPHTTMIYFEFDRHDSRYRDISSLLLYLLNAFAWRFPEMCEGMMLVELEFWRQAHAWSLEDLFHLYSMFRAKIAADIPERGLTIFISCFDQCPADQRQWFLESVLEQQSYSDSEYRIVMSTSAQDDLAVGAFPEETRINLDDCPALISPSDSLAEGLRSALGALIARRPIYEDLRPQLESLLEQCGDMPYLGRIILAWLGIHLRGRPRSVIADKISKLSPPTEENVVRVFIASLAPALRTRAETVFNWIKNAAEPWSPESLTEALAVRELDGGEPSFEDLDVQGTMGEIEEAFGGIVTLENGDVKFSHASFYRVLELGFEESGPEAAARANSTIAETCLRYFQLRCAQEALAELAQANLSPVGIPQATPVDAIMVSHPRTNMAEYAVRFWHQHYKSSGIFKPRKLVDDLFASKRARAGWEVSFWLLSNPFTRMERCYISTLPVFAMLGLEELVQEKVQNEKDQPAFEKDCWYAIAEAARAGHKAMVQQLLEHVAVDQEGLQTALHWAAARSDADTVNVILAKIPNLDAFNWPDNLMHQAAAAGLDDLLAAMLLSGYDIDETNELYYHATPVITAAWRSRVSTMEFLLSSEHKPDLTIEDCDRDTPILVVSTTGHPRMTELLVQGGASVENNDPNDKGPVQRAAKRCNHKAMDVLIKAGADFTSGTPGSEVGYHLRSPLVVAAETGSQECARVLLAHGADPNAESDCVTALYEAVAKVQPAVVRQLLSHDPKPDMDRSPADRLTLMMNAVSTDDAELVGLLVDHGAELHYVDPNGGTWCKSPFGEACVRGNLDVVKLLLEKGADINYAGEATLDSPLFLALNSTESNPEVVRFLLQDERIDVKRAAADGSTPLHGAGEPSFVTELLKRGALIDAYCIYYGTALHKAALANNPRVIAALLASVPGPEVEYVYGDDAWEKDEIGLTPLQLACKNNSFKSIRPLLRGGANPGFKNKNGDDAVDLLLRAGSDSKEALECLRLMLSVPYHVPANQVNEQGRTRLHNIQQTTPISVVELLVEAKTPWDTQDQEGHTPLSLAVSKGNESVARYLVNKNARVNRCGPSFGSILHLAVKQGDLKMTKFLLDSGADPKLVDPEYGESLLYTALGIEEDSKLKPMVRYLVDEAKVPIGESGGAEFRYPIIRAANLFRTNHPAAIQIINFLIRRKVPLDSQDDQGRRAVHVASACEQSQAILALIDAGAEWDVPDLLGRKPIHFAASVASYYPGSLFGITRIMEERGSGDINDVDHDGWTPFMWAARSAYMVSLEHLASEKGADIWTRSSGSIARDEWSALKLLNFTDRSWLEHELRRTRSIDQELNDGDKWSDPFHKNECGALKDANCNSCFAAIRGIQWKCDTCDDFSLCFKCYSRRSIAHNAEHGFDDFGPLYVEHSASPELSVGEDPSDDNDNSDDASQKTSGSQDRSDVEDSGNAAAPSRTESSSSGDSGPGFDNDSSDEED